MKEMEEGTVDVIVTSPPYNIGALYTTHDDRAMTRGDYLRWLGDVAKECRRVLKDNGSFFLNIGGKPSDPALPIEASMKVMEHFHLQNHIIWVKSIAIPEEESILTEDLSVGHYKPVNSTRYLSNCHETILHLTKHGDVRVDKDAIGVPYSDKTNTTRWGNGSNGLRDRGTTWFIPYETVKSAKGHPCSFPVELPMKCIKFHGLQEGLLVMDPFMGIGTTAIACSILGMRFIGFEVDASYIEQAVGRLAAHTEES
jgi:site-specific DNA-methyltransferase (adenine-specific)